MSAQVIDLNQYRLRKAQTNSVSWLVNDLESYGLPVEYSADTATALVVFRFSIIVAGNEYSVYQSYVIAEGEVLGSFQVSEFDGVLDEFVTKRTVAKGDLVTELVGYHDSDLFECVPVEQAL